MPSWRTKPTSNDPFTRNAVEKLKEFIPELVTLSFPEQDLRDNPQQINKGLCMRWAYMAYIMFEGVELYSIGAHAFVKYQGKFYDSERLQGEEDWKDLPACNFGVGCGCGICKQGIRKHTEENFKKFWNKNFIKPNWHWYRELAAEGLAKYASGEMGNNLFRAGSALV
jgi:hypothetical protein